MTTNASARVRMHEFHPSSVEELPMSDELLQRLREAGGL